VRAALLRLAPSLQPARTIAIARLIREAKALRARGNYIAALYEALCELSAKDRPRRLSLVAIVAVGTLHLAVENSTAAGEVRRGRLQEPEGRRLGLRVEVGIGGGAPTVLASTRPHTFHDRVLLWTNRIGDHQPSGNATDAPGATLGRGKERQ